VAPRRYEMRSRAAAVEETRQRIVTAAIRVFAENTAAASGMSDVSAAAGVSPATVYRHFGDFDGLAEACAQTAFNIAEVPTPEVAAQQFADLPSLAEKLERFIQISCHCYERAAEWLAAERRERHLPAFARTVGREEAALDAIVRGLLEPAGVDVLTVAAVRTLVDFPFWQALNAAGVATADIPPLVLRLVTDQLHHAGIDAGTRPDRRTDDLPRTRRARATTRRR
jgi:AcrR family transcriptional regulator